MKHAIERRPRLDPRASGRRTRVSPLISFADRRGPGAGLQAAGRSAAHWGALLLLWCIGFAPCVAAPEDGQTFRDWVVRCEAEAPAGEERCYIVQNLVLKDKKQRVLLLAITHAKEHKAPVALLTLPLGILLPPGVKLSVDGGKAYRFAVERCVSNGCKVGFLLEPALLASFKAGRQADVVIHDGTGAPVSLPVSLHGFTAGLAALR